MGKGTHFFGQPVYGQLIKCLNKDKIVEMSRNHGGERYIKSFDGWHHLLTMLYAVILRFDSLREIEASMLAEVRKLGHIGLKTIPRRSTLSDANARRSEKFFEDVYRDLYDANRETLSSDSRSNGTEEWIKRLRIIDSTTISLFSNLIFKGVGRHPKTGRKKGGIKVHTVISANENVPCDVKFTSAARYSPHLQAQMADRVSFQADKAELPAKVLLRREQQCHQDPDLGHADSKPADDTTSTETETQVELL